MDLSSSSQNCEIWMDCFCMSFPVVAIRSCAAWSMQPFRYSGYIVARRLKKYYLGGPLSFGYLSGKYCWKWASFLNMG